MARSMWRVASASKRASIGVLSDLRKTGVWMASEINYKGTCMKRLEPTRWRFESATGFSLQCGKARFLASYFALWGPPRIKWHEHERLSFTKQAYTTSNLYQPFPVRSFPCTYQVNPTHLMVPSGTPTYSLLDALDIETRTQCGPYLSGERRERSITQRQKGPSASHVRRTSEPSQGTHSSVTHTPNNTTWETELGQAQDAHCANCPPAECRYPGVQGKKFCSEKINCATIPGHFTSHGIENTSRKKVIHCKWNGCGKQVTRCAFVRHIREAHLEHKRGTRFHRSKKSPRRQPNTPVSCEIN
ncbi:hypothetical protein EDD15DRAFT_2196107 [Pisolithus albus]|nr:hypothetical protein EDD15DRAFT_2196107 [Pisolithus albus]